MKHSQYWFVPKRYGYGFVPVTWEGWLVTLVLVAVLIGGMSGVAWLQPAWFGSVDVTIAVLYVMWMGVVLSITIPWMKRRTKGELKRRGGKKDWE